MGSKAMADDHWEGMARIKASNWAALKLVFALMQAIVVLRLLVSSATKVAIKGIVNSELGIVKTELIKVRAEN